MSIVQQIQANENISEEQIKKAVLPMLDYGFGISNIENIYREYESFGVLKLTKKLVLKGYKGEIRYDFQKAFPKYLNVSSILKEAVKKKDTAKYIDKLPVISTRNTYAERFDRNNPSLKSKRKYLKRCSNRAKLFYKKKHGLIKANISWI